MNKYLSDDKIKNLKNYLHSNLSTYSLKMLDDIEKKTALNFADAQSKADNRKKFWTYANNCVRNLPKDNEINKLYKMHMDAARFQEAGEVVQMFINSNLKKEWLFITEQFDSEKIEKYVQNILSSNYISTSVLLSDIITAGIDQFCDNYSKKNVDKQAITATKEISDYVNGYWKGKGYNEYQYFLKAVEIYATTKDEQLLNNFLNNK